MGDGEKPDGEEPEKQGEKTEPTTQKVPVPTVKVALIGDSMWNCGRQVQDLEKLLDMRISCDAGWGGNIGQISKMKACSQYSDCKWSVINDAPADVWKKAGWQEQFEALVDRELAASKKVIIIGYPWHKSYWGSSYHTLMDKFAKMAAAHSSKELNSHHYTVQAGRERPWASLAEV